ncbi:hypothetical protein PHYSODRAFT_301143 [Phytophthora sojae]|uniref:Uncharacterized protein n=1 Tax=Phytophthora sojae (strain P6497) TaxID=1094619 RepID=G4ZFN6_PHYSP|nr:hypothetical protein PHYSODRAFT_301143 [Phytophthora sojae]EGZ18504.1 hypothetical protein PHYSODRAFT_301143 [Phytophthora sojae]|eukprot:XP_009527562.1 hypothetical protein PHYSODRAFT_301143 [Phytophthora sojae]
MPCTRPITSFFFPRKPHLLPQPRSFHNQAPVSANQVPVVVNAEKSLLKTRLLEGEKIVAESAETPVCNNFCREGQIRRIQLTNRRTNYFETYRKNCCFKTASLLRQVFLKDVCEVAVDNYGRVAESWLKKLANFLLLVGSPAAGATLLVIGRLQETRYSRSYYYNDDGRCVDCDAYYGGGGALLAFWVLYAIYRLCRRPVPEVVFCTRCPQFAAFAIRLPTKADRIRLLEEVTTLLSKSQ